MSLEGLNQALAAAQSNCSQVDLSDFDRMVFTALNGHSIMYLDAASAAIIADICGMFDTGICQVGNSNFSAAYAHVLYSCEQSCKYR